MTTTLKNLKVLNDYIIIAPFQQAEEEISEGGLIVPRAPGSPSLVYHYARVMGIGDECYAPGHHDVSVGDVVYYAQKNASALAVVEEGYMYDPRKANYAYIKPSDIIAVVTSEDNPSADAARS